MYACRTEPAHPYHPKLSSRKTPKAAALSDNPGCRERSGPPGRVSMIEGEMMISIEKPWSFWAAPLCLKTNP